MDAVIILSFSLLVTTLAKITSFDDNVHSVLVLGANCFSQLAIQSFDQNANLAIVKSRGQYVTPFSLGVSSEDLILQKLINTDSWSIMTKFIGAGAKPRVEFGFEKIHNYVIFFQNAVDLENALYDLSHQKSWNSHGKFLCYFVGFPDNFETTMEEVVKVFWSFWVINLTILVPLKSINGHVIVTYYPYHGGNCGRGKVSFTITGQCIEQVEPDGLDIFPEKIPQDLNRCLVKVGAMESPPFVIKSETTYPSLSLSLDSGIEMALIESLSKAANFEVELSMSYMTLSQDLDNITSGLLMELLDRKVDIAVGTISPTTESHRRFDFSVQYMQDVSSWIVPSDRVLPHWMGLVKVFQPTVFAVTICLLLFQWFACSTIVKLCASNFRWEHESYKQSGSLFLITVGMLLASQPRRFPNTKFLKYIVLMWSLFCFYWSSSFSASFMSVITNTVYRDGVAYDLTALPAISA